MSHFYGTLQGDRGVATRCGTARSGISASAQGWAGSATVTQENRHGDRDTLYMSIGRGSTTGGSSVLCIDMRDAVEAVERGERLFFVTDAEREFLIGRREQTTHDDAPTSCGEDYDDTNAICDGCTVGQRARCAATLEG
jgi:hypothetical protein